MGAWGPGIFESDAACDVRGLAMELLTLGLDPALVRQEIERDLGDGNGNGDAEQWIALALTMHKIGRIDEGVRSKALELIDSGQALQEWIALTDTGDPSIKARARHLQKARDKLVSPLPKPKRLKPADELLCRIDRTYRDFPWRQDGLYAYRIDEHFVVLAAIAVQPSTQLRHYRSTPVGYEPVPRPVLTEAVLLLLDYRGTRPPNAREARSFEPFVASAPIVEQERMIRHDEIQRKVWEFSANETFDLFEQRTKAMLGHFTDQQLRERHALVVTVSRQKLALFTNPQRHFYRRYWISAREPVPLDRLTDLAVEQKFPMTDPTSDAATRTTWSGLDGDLAGLPLQS